MESFEGRRLNIVWVQENHIEGCGVIDFMMGSESGVWEGMEGVVVRGRQSKRKGRVYTCNVS